MARESVIYGILLGVMIVGLALVVFVEATGADRMLLLIGGGLALAGVGGIATLIARLPEPEHGGHT